MEVEVESPHPHSHSHSTSTFARVGSGFANIRNQLSSAQLKGGLAVWESFYNISVAETRLTYREGKERKKQRGFITALVLVFGFFSP